MRLALFSLLSLFFVTQALAGKIQSEYTRLSLDKDCTFTETYEQGGSATCKGYKDYPIYFSEGDLRQQVTYGFVDGSYDAWESFNQFNQINETVEWRLEGGKPFATILRWFINNEEPNMAAITSESRGNVLVVSKVATRQEPQSCVVGYIDTRANKNANFLARDVADKMARDFKCGKDAPRFHGNKGQWSGTPTIYEE